MNELTKIKDRILARIEEYIEDMEMTEVLTFNEKTILDSAKEIVNEEFEKTPTPLPRFKINKNGELEQIKASDEDVKFTDKEVKKFQKYIDEYKEMCATDKDRICKDTITYTEAIFKLSNTYGVSYILAKDMAMEMLVAIKGQQENTAKWIEAGVGVDCLGHRFKEYKCSNCGNIDLSHKKNKFCPECGKRMVE